MDIHKSILEGQVRQFTNTVRVMGGEPVKNIQKSVFDDFEDDIQKGAKAAVGEVRIWKGKKYRKEPDGSWSEVNEKGNNAGKVGETYTEEHLERIVKKAYPDSHHFEDMNDAEVRHLHSFANANLFNSGLNQFVKDRVKGWWKLSTQELSKRKKEANK